MCALCAHYVHLHQRSATVAPALGAFFIDGRRHTSWQLTQNDDGGVAAHAAQGASAAAAADAASAMAFLNRLGATASHGSLTCGKGDQEQSKLLSESRPVALCHASMLPGGQLSAAERWGLVYRAVCSQPAPRSYPLTFSHSSAAGYRACQPFVTCV